MATTAMLIEPESSEDEEQVYSEEGSEDEDEDVDIDGDTESEEDEPNYETNSDEPIHVTLKDPHVFDCPICLEPLTIPVFQCYSNGHIACSKCRPKIKICPSCSCPFGSSRCRAFENVLESSTVSCRNKKYFCPVSFPYDQKQLHERRCEYSPCSCPYAGCNKVAAYTTLYRHFNTTHPGSATSFAAKKNFSVTLTKNRKFAVLQDKNHQTLFILKNRVIEGVGNALSLACLQPSFLGEYYYDLSAKNTRYSLRLQSRTKSVKSYGIESSAPMEENFLLIPVHFSASTDQLKINLYIYPKGEKPPR